MQVSKNILHFCVYGVIISMLHGSDRTVNLLHGKIISDFHEYLPLIKHNLYSGLQSVFLFVSAVEIIQLIRLAVFAKG